MSAVRAVVAQGELAGHDALVLHVQHCERCAAAALEAALERVGLPPRAPEPESDEIRVALMAAGLETPAERRILERNSRATPGDASLRRALTEEDRSLTKEDEGRTEHSVLINMDTLSRTALGPRATSTEASPRRARDADASGLIDLGALGLDKPSQADGGGDFKAFSPASAPVGAMTLLPRPKRSVALPAIAGALVALLAAGGGWWALHRTSAGDQPVAAGATGLPAMVASAAPSPAPSAAPVAFALATAPGSAAAVEPPTTVATARGARPAAARPRSAGQPLPAGGASVAPAPASVATAVAPKPARKGSDEVDDLLGGLSGRGNKPAGGNNAGAAPVDNGDPGLAQQLSKPQILGVVKKAAGSISGCKSRQADVSGTVVVTMKIEKSGRVGSASAKAPFAGSPVGNCVENIARGFQFPQFSGDTMTINMPFAL